MPNHTTGPCGLGDRCSGRGFEIRAKYKCCFSGFQLHNPLSGCSRTHGEDDDKVKCVDTMKCLQGNSASGRCACQPQGSHTINSKSSGDEAGGKKMRQHSGYISWSNLFKSHYWCAHSKARIRSEKNQHWRDEIEERISLE